MSSRLPSPARVRPTGAAAEDVGGGGRAEKPEGSVGHDTGDYKPRSHFVSKIGCRIVADCKFCHVGHEKYRSEYSRPCKSTRNQSKQIAAMLETGAYPGPSEVVEDMSRYSGYIRRIASGIRKRRSGGELDDNDGEDAQRQQQQTRSMSGPPPLRDYFSSSTGTMQRSMFPSPFPFAFFAGRPSCGTCTSPSAPLV